MKAALRNGGDFDIVFADGGGSSRGSGLKITAGKADRTFVKAGG